jgi:hypothetical protein
LIVDTHDTDTARAGFTDPWMITEIWDVDSILSRDLENGLSPTARYLFTIDGKLDFP